MLRYNIVNAGTVFPVQYSKFQYVPRTTRSDVELLLPGSHLVAPSNRMTQGYVSILRTSLRCIGLFQVSEMCLPLVKYCTVHYVQYGSPYSKIGKYRLKDHSYGGLWYLLGGLYILYSTVQSAEFNTERQAFAFQVTNKE